jgi:hypothetical protein
MRNVSTRKLDVFTEGDTYILQTTGHPKINVTEFLNFLSFEKVNDAVSRVDSLSDRKGVRVSGLLEGERFEFNDHYVYPTGV